MDSTGIYIKQLSNTEFFSREEEQRLFRAARAVGSPAAANAREKLIHSVLPLVIHIVSTKFSDSSSHVSRDDLIQAGNVGAVLAVDRFDPGRGTRLTTYAYRSIMNHVRRFRTEHGFLAVRAPTSYSSCGQRRRSQMDEQLKPFVRSISIDKLLPKTRVNGDGLTVRSIMADPNSERHVAGVADADDRRWVMRLVRKHLSSRQQHIIMSRARGRKLHEIGEELGITKERVRQIERLAIWKLRMEAVKTQRGRVA